jgi:hypothetical protein
MQFEEAIAAYEVASSHLRDTRKAVLHIQEIVDSATAKLHEETASMTSALRVVAMAKEDILEAAKGEEASLIPISFERKRWSDADMARVYNCYDPEDQEKNDRLARELGRTPGAIQQEYNVQKKNGWRPSPPSIALPAAPYNNDIIVRQGEPHVDCQ